MYMRLAATTVADVDPEGTLSNEPFTMTELREVHQALGNDMHKDTFSRHALPHLKQYGVRKNAVGRPAVLYTKKVTQ